MRRFLPGWRGLTQLLAVTVLPLTILLLIIAFGSVTLHQRDMRALVGERDARAVHAAATALESALHHRVATISGMSAFASASGTLPFGDVLDTSNDLISDFDGGVAFLDPGRRVLVNTDHDALWGWVAKNGSSLLLASSSDPQAVFSVPFIDPDTQRTFAIISAYSVERGVIAAGAFSPEMLATQILTASYPVGSEMTIYLLDSSRRILFTSGTPGAESISADHPGVPEVLRGESGALYVPVNKSEHVIAYSPVPVTGWALITEEAWESVSDPSLQATQMAPLVIVPAFILALIAVWFGAKQIVQPLQRLESKAAALAWGDFNAINESVGGISEVKHLQSELTEMSRKVRAAQEGLHDYIGAITAAQEEERMRLARELHDDTIQAVIALKQRVQLAHKSIKGDGGHKILTELEALAEETIKNLRRLTRALRPIYLEDLGLVTALEMLARETSRDHPLQVDFHRSGLERRLPREVELAFYRIAQEALNNIVRHANAKLAALRIQFNDEIRLEVTDDGTGFIVPKSPTDFVPKGHFGLLGMHERADLIGALLEVRSEPGHGTRVSLSLHHMPMDKTRTSEPR